MIVMLSVETRVCNVQSDNSAAAAAAATEAASASVSRCSSGVDAASRRLSSTVAPTTGLRAEQHGDRQLPTASGAAAVVSCCSRGDNSRSACF